MAANNSNEYCSAISCNNRRKNCPGLSFFKFPKDEERCKKWVQSTRREDFQKKTVKYLNVNCLLCANHFEPSQFMNIEKRNKLVWNAIPSLFDISNPPPLVTSLRKAPAKRTCETSYTKRKKSTADKENLPAKRTRPPSPRKQPELGNIEKTPLSSIQDNNQDNSSEFLDIADNDVPLIKVKLFKGRKCLKKKIAKIYRLQCKLKKSKNSMQSKLEKELARPETIIAASKKFLPPIAHALFSAQIYIGANKKKHWSEEVKHVALALHYNSPKAYRVLSKVISLPSERTLQGYLQGIEMKPGISNQVLDVLSVKAKEMTPNDRLCALVIDEMSLKCGLVYDAATDKIEGMEDYGNLGNTSYIANHVSVLMVKGIQNKWKQPIGFYFTSDSTPANILQEIVTEAIVNLQDAGLNVKALIGDQGQNNRSLFKKLNISEDNPFFLIREQKIFCLFDVPHLLKSVRNNLRKYDFEVNGQVIKWEYIKTFYEKDSSSTPRLAHKLTKKHFEYNTFGAMRVYLAAQLFSLNVYAGMMTHTLLEYLPPDAVNTALFVKKMDDIFDCMNSRRPNADKPRRCGLKSDSDQIDFLKKSREWFKQIQVLNPKKKNPPCLQGWIVTISSVIQLWEDVNKNHQVTCLLTARLNQDCLENLFSILRSKGGCADNPTPTQCRRNLKSLVASFLMKPSPGSNCRESDDFMFTSLSTFIKSSKKPKLAKCNTETDCSVLSVPNIDLSKMELDSVLMLNVHSYIAGYFCSKLLKEHKCEKCEEVLLGEKSFSGDQQIFTMFNAYTSEKGSDFGKLTIASEGFTSVVHACEKAFFSFFEGIMVQSSVKKKLISILKEHCEFSLPVCDAVKESFWNFYSTTRMHWALRFLNRELVNDRQLTLKKNRKYLKITHV